MQAEEPEGEAGVLCYRGEAGKVCLLSSLSTSIEGDEGHTHAGIEKMRKMQKAASTLSSERSREDVYRRGRR